MWAWTTDSCDVFAWPRNTVWDDASEQDNTCAVMYSLSLSLFRVREVVTVNKEKKKRKSESGHCTRKRRKKKKKACFWITIRTSREERSGVETWQSHAVGHHYARHEYRYARGNKVFGCSRLLRVILIFFFFFFACYALCWNSFILIFV